MLVRAPTARTAPQQVSFRRDDAANCRLSLSQPGARRRRHRRDAFSVASGSGASVPEQSGAAKGAQAAPPGDRTDAGAYASCSSDSSPRISVVERRFSAFFQEVLTQEKEDEWESVRQKEYTEDDWERHRGRKRFIRSLLSLPSSRRVQNTVFPVLSSFGLTITIGLYQTIEVLEPQLHLPPPVGIGSPLISLGTTVLSFLLVFRTNKSSGRFDEAHRLWGLLKARCRDTLRLCGGLFPRDPGGQASFQAAGRWIPAFCQCLRVHVGRPAGEDLRILEGWLRPEELEALSRTSNRPQYCLQVLGELVRQNVPEPNRRVALDENIRALGDVLGGCERVYRRPIPSEPESLSYSRQTSRFLYIWAVIFPFAFWHEVEWAALLFAPLLTYLLYAIDDIGEQYDRPFTAMPLAQMCGRITRDCQEVVAQAESAERLAEWALATAASADPSTVPAWAVSDASEEVSLAATQAEATLRTAALRDRSAEKENRPTPLEFLPPPLGFGAPGGAGGAAGVAGNLRLELMEKSAAGGRDAGPSAPDAAAGAAAALIAASATGDDSLASAAAEVATAAAAAAAAAAPSSDASAPAAAVVDSRTQRR